LRPAPFKVGADGDPKVVQSKAICVATQNGYPEFVIDNLLCSAQCDLVGAFREVGRFSSVE
jgi:hypothetical protein